MKNKVYYLLIISFLLLITAPFWGMLFYTNEDTNEKRVLTRIEDVKGISQLNQYIVDNHAFRDKLSGSCLSFYTKVLKESPLPSQTVFGKDEWMFLGNDYMNIYNSSLGIAPVWQADVNKTTQNIHQIHHLCDSLGIDFYFVIAPNKATIYPENLALTPNQLPTFRTHLKDSLKTKFDFEIIDLTDLMKKKKTEIPVYYKYDSHWNDYGALLATEELTKRIATNNTIDLIEPSQFDIKEEQRGAEKDREYDLSIILNMKVMDTFFEVRPKKEVNIQDTIIKKWGNAPVVVHSTNSNSNNNTKGFIIRDSFFIAVYPFFLSSIHDASLFMSFNKELILEEIERNGKPDFLMYIIAERNLTRVNYQ